MNFVSQEVFDQFKAEMRDRMAAVESQMSHYGEHDIRPWVTRLDLATGGYPEPVEGPSIGNDSATEPIEEKNQ